MSEKIKKNEKAKKQTWRAGNMLYPCAGCYGKLCKKRREA